MAEESVDSIVEEKKFSLNINGREINAKSYGDSNLPVILAIHDHLDNLNSFEHILPHFTSKFHCISFDLQGHGDSSSLPDGTPHRFSDYVFDLIDIIKELDLNNLCLVGHGLGGELASVLAATYPEKVNLLVLLDSFLQEKGKKIKAHEQIRATFDNMASKVEKDFNSFDEALDFYISQKKGILKKDKEKFSGIVRANIHEREDKKLIFKIKNQTLGSPKNLDLSDEEWEEIIVSVKCPVFSVNGNKSKRKDLVNKFFNIVHYEVDYGMYFHIVSPLEIVKQIVSWWCNDQCEGNIFCTSKCPKNKNLKTPENHND